MRSKLLLPHYYKYLGWCLLVGSAILWILVAIMDTSLTFFQTKTFVLLDGGFFQENKYLSTAEIDLTNTVMGSLFIVGGLLVAFSREKIEDEFIMNLRLSSFKWAVLINYLILLVLLLFVHGFYFLVAMVYNMFSVLILFIVRFNYLLFKSRISNHEK